VYYCLKLSFGVQRGGVVFNNRVNLFLAALKKMYKIGLQSAHLGNFVKMLGANKRCAIYMANLVKTFCESPVVQKLCLPDDVIKNNAELINFVCS
jgi:hypothetical protein